MKKARENITLPSGAKCRVRRIAGDDFIAAGLTPVIADIKKSARAAAATPTEMSERDLQNMVKVTRMMLLRCVGAITDKDGTVFRIVDKAIDDLGEFDITIEELDQEDANAIVSAIHKLSGLTKEAASAAAPFPAEQAATPSPSSDSEGIRAAAN